MRLTFALHLIVFGTKSFAKTICILLLSCVAFFTPKNAIAQQSKADSLLKALPTKPDSIRAWKLLDIANLYLQSDSLKVEKYTKEALALSKTLNFGRGEARSYAILGELAYYYGDLKRSEHWFDVSIERCKVLNRVEDYKLTSLNSKAILAYTRGDYKKVIEYTNITISKAEIALTLPSNKTYAFERVVYMGFNLQGLVFAANAFNRNKELINTHEFGKAYQSYKRCLALCKTYKTLERNLPTVYHNIARYFKDSRQSADSTLYYLNQEIAVATRLNQDSDLIAAYCTQAELLYDQGLYQAAEKVLNKAQPLAQKYHDSDEATWIPNLMAKIYLQTGKYQQAEVLLKQSLDWANTRNKTEDVRSITETLIKTLDKKGDYKNAYLYSKKLATLKDSLYNQSKTKIIHELATKYETEQKEQTIKALQTQESLKKYIIGALLLAGCISAFAIWNKHKANNLERQVLIQTTLVQEKEKEKIQSKLEAKQRELALQGLYLDQRKNVLQDVKKMFLNGSDDLLNRQAILKEIDAIPLAETEWQNFKVHIESVHPDFFKKLLLKNPTLTDLDLRQCAYVKLGMSPKQVAALLSIEADSVSMARVRLKKKLNLDTEVSLYAFLTSF